MSLRTPISQARGLGSAKQGTNHWWAQRVTALALIFLSLWFVVSLLFIVRAEHHIVVQWIGWPLNSVLLVAFLVATFYHASLGLQVVIEDYVHVEGKKIVALLVMKSIVALVGIAAIFAVLRIAFGG